MNERANFETGSQANSPQVILAAIDAVNRFASRGCSGMACDRVRGTWLGNQLGVIGRAASGMPPEVRDSYIGVPWERLAALVDPKRGITAMSADEMQRFVEQELPRVKQALMQQYQRAS